MKPKLAMVRIPPVLAEMLARNKQLRDHFDILWAGERYYRVENDGVFWATVDTGTDPSTVRQNLEKIFDAEGVTHVLLSQPLMWYSNLVTKICKDIGIKLVNYEVFLGDFHIFDTIGSQYTHDNEIVRYASTCRTWDPRLPCGTRFEQPDGVSPPELYQRYGDPHNTIVLFGQMEGDMSLVDVEGRIPYAIWMQELVGRNPEVTFLVKDHPLMTKRDAIAPTVERLFRTRENVKLFEESIQSAFRAYWAFAAYSSTTIVEGAFRGIPFITGGYHFLDDPALALRVTAKEEFNAILPRYEEFEPDVKAVHRRLGFITGIYTMKADDPRILDRILLSADEFYGRHGGTQA